VRELDINLVYSNCIVYHLSLGYSDINLTIYCNVTNHIFIIIRISVNIRYKKKIYNKNNLYNVIILK